MSVQSVSSPRDPWIPNEDFSIPWMPDDIYISILDKLDQPKDVLSCRQISHRWKEISDQKPTIQRIWSELFCRKFWSELSPSLPDCRYTFQRVNLFHDKMLHTSYAKVERWEKATPGSEVGKTTRMLLNNGFVYSLKDEGKLLQIWNASTGELLKTIEEVKDNDPANKSVHCLFTFNDIIVLGRNDGSVSLRSAKNGDLIKHLEGEDVIINIYYENSILMVATRNKIKLYDTSNACFNKLCDVAMPFLDCEYACMNRNLYHIDAKKGKIHITTPWPSFSYKCLDIKELNSSFDISYVYITNQNIFVAITQRSSSKILIFDAKDYKLKKTLEGNQSAIENLVVHNKKLIAYSNNRFQVWDDTIQCSYIKQATIRVYSNRVYWRNLLLYRLYDKIYVWNLTNGKSNIIGTSSGDMIEDFLIWNGKMIVLRQDTGIETWDIWLSPIEIYQEIADSYSKCEGNRVEYQRARDNFLRQPDSEIRSSIFCEFGAISEISDPDTARIVFLDLYFKDESEWKSVGKLRAQAIRNALAKQGAKPSLLNQ